MPSWHISFLFLKNKQNKSLQISSLPVTLGWKIHKINLIISSPCLNCLSFIWKMEILMDSSEPSISHLPENCIPHVLASEIYRLSMALCYVPSPSLSRWTANAGSFSRTTGQMLTFFWEGCDDVLKVLTSFQMIRNLGNLSAKPKFLFPEGAFHSWKGRVLAVQ